MADYLTEEILTNKFGEERLIELADHDNDGEIDTAVLARSIEAAEATVNAHLNGRYNLAAVVTAQPEIVINIAADICLYELGKSRSESLVADDTPLRAIYKDAMALLRDIARGLIALNVQSVSPDAGLQISSNPRKFSRDTMCGF